MRLDKFLKVSRLIKRRTVANKACDTGRVEVNGKIARASYDVKEGDRITIRFGERALTVEVVSVQENAGKAEAAMLYRELGSETEVILLTAGDSRPYVWTEKDGLCQLTRDEERPDGADTAMLLKTTVSPAGMLASTPTGNMAASDPDVRSGSVSLSAAL